MSLTTVAQTSPSRIMRRSTSLFQINRNIKSSSGVSDTISTGSDLIDWRQILASDPDDGPSSPPQPTPKKKKRGSRIQSKNDPPPKLRNKSGTTSQVSKRDTKPKTSNKVVEKKSKSLNEKNSIPPNKDSSKKANSASPTPPKISFEKKSVLDVSITSKDLVDILPVYHHMESEGDDTYVIKTNNNPLNNSTDFRDDSSPDPMSPDFSPPNPPLEENGDSFDTEISGLDNSHRRRSMDDCHIQDTAKDDSEQEQDLDLWSFLQEPAPEKAKPTKIGKGLYVTILEQRVKELEESILHLKRIAPSKPANRLLKSSRVSQNLLNPSNTSNGIERPLKIVKKRIEIGERISSGASLAVVYSCYVDGWLCAMKELNTENISSLDIQIFQEEIKLLEYLPKHPNVCQYLFHDYSDNKIRLFMTNYHTTLRNELDRRETLLQPSEIAIYAHDIIKGLEFLHRNSVLHRDLKAENIFGFHDQEMKICSLVIGDFDTAKRITNKEMLNSVAGSPAWMAPEVLNANISGEEYSFPIDIYSFGMTLYELLSLKTPYEGISFLTLTEHILSGEQPILPSSVIMDDNYSVLLEIFYGSIKHDVNSRITLPIIKTQLENFIPNIANSKLKHLSK